MCVPILYGPDGKPINTPQSPQRRKPRQRRSPKGSRYIRQWIAKSWAGILAVSTIAGCAIGIYVLRPIPTPYSVTPLDPSNPYATDFSILNNGQLEMRDVEVDCEETKVVFSNEHTLNSGEHMVLSQYRVGHVRPGEPLTLLCPQTWRLFIDKSKSSGLLTFGDIDGPRAFNTLVFAFQIMSNKQIRLTHEPARGQLPMIRPPLYPISKIDMRLVIKYHIFLPFLLLSKTLRFTTETSSDGQLKWISIPLSEKDIPDGIGGLILWIQGGNFIMTHP